MTAIGTRNEMAPADGFNYSAIDKATASAARAVAGQVRSLRIGLSILAIITLSGCVSVQSRANVQNRADLDLQQARITCNDRLKAHELRNYRDGATCLDEAEDLYASQTNEQDLDLLQELQAARRVRAAKVDAGKMTLAEAQLEAAQLRSAMKDRSAARRSQRVGEAMAIMQAFPVQPAYTPAPIVQPAYVIPSRTINTNCLVMSGLVSCQSQ